MLVVGLVRERGAGAGAAVGGGAAQLSERWQPQRCSRSGARGAMQRPLPRAAPWRPPVPPPHVQPPPDLALSPQLDVYALIQAQPDEIERLLHGRVLHRLGLHGCWLLLGRPRSYRRPPWVCRRVARAPRGAGSACRESDLATSARTGRLGCPRVILTVAEACLDISLSKPDARAASCEQKRPVSSLAGRWRLWQAAPASSPQCAVISGVQPSVYDSHRALGRPACA